MDSRVMMESGTYRIPNPKWISYEESRWMSRFFEIRVTLLAVQADTDYDEVYVLIMYQKNSWGRGWKDVRRRAYRYERNAKRTFKLWRRELANKEEI